jgi:hypothetical protein
MFEDITGHLKQKMSIFSLTAFIIGAHSGDQATRWTRLNLYSVGGNVKKC